MNYHIFNKEEVFFCGKPKSSNLTIPATKPYTNSHYDSNDREYGHLVDKSGSGNNT